MVDSEQNVLNGLGFMWNPKPVGTEGGTFSALANPQVWLEAAGPIDKSSVEKANTDLRSLADGWFAF